jgi:hypothetical protein
MESWVDARLRDGMLGGLHSVGEYPGAWHVKRQDFRYGM